MSSAVSPICARAMQIISGRDAPYQELVMDKVEFATSEWYEALLQEFRSALRGGKPVLGLVEVLKTEMTMRA